MQQVLNKLDVFFQLQRAMIGQQSQEQQEHLQLKKNKSQPYLLSNKWLMVYQVLYIFLFVDMLVLLAYIKKTANRCYSLHLVYSVVIHCNQAVAVLV